jgi:hypothetical protein
VALGTLAVGDDSHPRLGLVQRPDRLPPRRLGIVLPGRPAAHVDDRDVDAADVPDQLQALGAILGLVDLEAVSQRFAHSEANQRVSVDHKAMWALGTQSRILAEPGPPRAVEKKP